MSSLRRSSLLLAGALAFAAPTLRAQDDCVRCDRLYGSTGGTEPELFELDPRTGALRVVGPTASFADLALTSDGRLFGLGRLGELAEVDPCTGEAAPTALFTVRPGATGTTRPDELLVSGSHLQRVRPDAGTIEDLPSGGWCGLAAGDLALNPCSGEAWQLSRGPACACPSEATLLEVLDPITGDHLRDLSCLPFESLFGLAFDSSCTAWIADADTGELIRVDPSTGDWSVVPAPDLRGTLGLASQPCDIAGTCDAGGPYEAACTGAGTAAALLDGRGSGLPSAEPLVHEWTVRCAAGDTSALGALVELELDAACDATCEVELVVSNAEGRQVSCTTTLHVADEAAPALLGVPADAEVDCDAVPPPAAVVARDACDPSPALGFLELREDGPCPGRYRLERRWTATDACGHETTAARELSVVDREAPQVEASDEIVACLWPPNHGLVAVPAELFAPVVEEACSEPVSWRLSGCRADEPEDGLGDGRTLEDCRVADDGSSLLVRAERLGNEDGRLYSVLVVATDACGNESEPTLAGRVFVAHDRREHLDCLGSAPRGR